MVCLYCVAVGGLLYSVRSQEAVLSGVSVVLTFVCWRLLPLTVICRFFVCCSCHCLFCPLHCPCQVPVPVLSLSCPVLSCPVLSLSLSCPVPVLSLSWNECWSVCWPVRAPMFSLRQLQHPWAPICHRLVDSPRVGRHSVRRNTSYNHYRNINSAPSSLA